MAVHDIPNGSPHPQPLLTESLNAQREVIALAERVRGEIGKQLFLFNLFKGQAAK